MADRSLIEWRPIPSWPKYEVTEDGSIRNAKRKRLMRLRPSKSGHMYFLPARGKKCYAHRAVLEAFVGPCPPGQEGRHLDGNPKNNHKDNLAWGTKIQQWEDDRRIGKNRCKPIKLDAERAEEIRNLHGVVTSREVGRRFGISHSVVLKIWKGKIWATRAA